MGTETVCSAGFTPNASPGMYSALAAATAASSWQLVSRLWKEIAFGTVIRTVAVPILGLAGAFLIPGLGGEHFATYVGVFATPVAVASAIMAQEMGADGELAGQMVVWTSLVSTVTIFIYVTILRAIEIF